MNTPQDGGPIASGMEVHTQGESQRLFAVGGLTIRDWFAGMALQGAAMYVNEHADVDGRGNLAKSCYAIADAMLAARKESA